MHLAIAFGRSRNIDICFVAVSTSTFIHFVLGPSQKGDHKQAETCFKSSLTKVFAFALACLYTHPHPRCIHVCLQNHQCL